MTAQVRGGPLLAPMATKPASRRVREEIRKLAAPFWKRVEGSGLDRFVLERLLRALLRRWKEDRFARVRQGGIHGDSRAELARVFVDLDATPGWQGGPTRKQSESERIVASWMKSPSKVAGAGGRLDPHGFDSGPCVPLEVVLGGPGQGKSTVGRLLVLIHSAILLLSSPLEGIVQRAEAAHLEELLVGLSAEEIQLPDVVRLPVWIELRELADGLLHDDESERDPLGAMLKTILA